MDHSFLTVLWATGLTSLFACTLVVATSRWHGRFTLDTHHGIQKMHVRPTPRVGGVSVFLALVVSDTLVMSLPTGQLLTALLLAAFPAFFGGLLEDLFKGGGVYPRLGGTFLSALLGVWLLDVSLTRVDVVGLDALLRNTPLLAAAFTIFAVAGVANAVNIIDGFNGLASGTVAISSSALGLIAYGQGDLALAGVCLVLASALLGFLVLNFPFGKIFLGDGGAYLLGFLLAWLAVLLVERNSGVSAWAALLACGYPVIEAVFSILRRVQRRSHFGLPDRLHLHSLIKVRFVRKKLGFLSPVLRNSFTSLPLWGYTLVMAAVAVAWPGEVRFLVLAFLAACTFYWVWYLRIVRFGSR